MNVFGIIVVAFTQASASDVGSLMQTGVKGHAASGFAFAIDNIQNQILNLPLPKGDQLAINALLTSVTEDLDPSSEPGSPGAQLNSSFNQILDLFGQIQVYEISLIDGYVATYQTWATNHSSCSNKLASADQDANNSFDNFLVHHYSCRVDEVQDFTNQQQACQDADDQIELLKTNLGTTSMNTGLGSGTITCVVPEPAPQPAVFDWGPDDHSYKSWMGDVKDSFAVTSSTLDNFVLSWSDFEQDCINNHTTWKATREDCNLKQNTLTNKYCAWRTVRASRCQQITDCETPYNNKKATADDATEPLGTYTYASLTVQHIEILRHIDHLTCLIQGLQQGYTDLSRCPLLPASHVDYNAYTWPVRTAGVVWSADAVCNLLANRPANASSYHDWIHASNPGGWDRSKADFSQNTSACP